MSPPPLTPDELAGYLWLRFHAFLVAPAIAEEREACATVADEFDDSGIGLAHAQIAAAIRARSVLTYPPDAAAPRSPGAARGV